AAGQTDPDPTGVDLFVCTHGRRDVCCGTDGTALWRRLSAPKSAGGLGDVVRLWRTSHTGGHRFAPTGAVFPSGQYWAWLDPGLVRAVLGREGPVADVVPHYRGSAA